MRLFLVAVASVARMQSTASHISPAPAVGSRHLSVATPRAALGMNVFGWGRDDDQRQPEGRPRAAPPEREAAEAARATSRAAAKPYARGVADARQADSDDQAELSADDSDDELDEDGYVIQRRPLPPVARNARGSRAPSSAQGPVSGAYGPAGAFAQGVDGDWERAGEYGGEFEVRNVYAEPLVSLADFDGRSGPRPGLEPAGSPGGSARRAGQRQGLGLDDFEIGSPGDPRMQDFARSIRQEGDWRLNVYSAWLRLWGDPDSVEPDDFFEDSGRGGLQPWGGRGPPPVPPRGGQARARGGGGGGGGGWDAGPRAPAPQQWAPRGRGWPGGEPEWGYGEEGARTQPPSLPRARPRRAQPDEPEAGGWGEAGQEQAQGPGWQPAGSGRRGAAEAWQGLGELDEEKAPQEKAPPPPEDGGWAGAAAAASPAPAPQPASAAAAVARSGRAPPPAQPQRAVRVALPPGWRSPQPAAALALRLEALQLETERTWRRLAERVQGLRAALEELQLRSEALDALQLQLTQQQPPDASTSERLRRLEQQVARLRDETARMQAEVVEVEEKVRIALSGLEQIETALAQTRTRGVEGLAQLALATEADVSPSFQAYLQRLLALPTNGRR